MNLDECKKLCKTYKNRSELYRKNKKCYNTAKSYGILEEVFLDKKIEFIIDIAKKCKDYKEFRLNYPSQYLFLLKKNKQNKVKKLFESPKRKLSREKIIKTGKSCKSRSEFYKKDSYCYMLALKLNILDEIFNKDACENNHKRRCRTCGKCKDKKDFTSKTLCKSCRNKKDREKKQKDPLFKLKSDIRSKILKVFKNKTIKTENIVGCSFDFLKQHIESQFLDWMSWENKGDVCDFLQPKCSWDIDHIIPLSSAKNKEELLKLNHWSNLQPLCSYINRNVKKDKKPLVCNIHFNKKILLQ